MARLFCCCCWNVGAATSCWGADGVAPTTACPRSWFAIEWACCCVNGVSLGVGSRLCRPIGGRLPIGGCAIRVPPVPRYPCLRPRARNDTGADATPSLLYDCCRCDVGALGSGCPPMALTVATSLRSDAIICCMALVVASSLLILAS